MSASCFEVSFFKSFIILTGMLFGADALFLYIIFIISEISSDVVGDTEEKTIGICKKMRSWMFNIFYF